MIDDIDPSIFSNALLSLEFVENNLEKKCQVFGVMLRQPKFAKDPEMWIKYIYFLGTNGQVGRAKQQYERALALIDDTQSRTMLNGEYAKFKF